MLSLLSMVIIAIICIVLSGLLMRYTESNQDKDDGPKGKDSFAANSQWMNSILISISWVLNGIGGGILTNIILRQLLPAQILEAVRSGQNL